MPVDGAIVSAHSCSSLILMRNETNMVFSLKNKHASEPVSLGLLDEEDEVLIHSFSPTFVGFQPLLVSDDLATDNC